MNVWFPQSPGRMALHLLLLSLTALSTFVTFYVVFGGGQLHGGLDPERARGALCFSAALLAILGSHEMGHYLWARHHQVDATLPYFIPAPLLGVGTFGAVIRIKSRIPHRNALVDIGAAGPLAGLAVAIPVLALGYHWSSTVWTGQVVTPFPGDFSLWTLGHDLIRWLRHLPEPAPHALGVPVTVFGDNLMTLAVQRLVVGRLPPGMTVEAHPLVIAGWFGTLVTLLNLLPVGQLDGGHLTHALWGKRAVTLGKGVAVVLLGLCTFATAAWVLWLLIATWVVGFRHPEVVDPAQPLSNSRKWVCALCLLALLVCLMPVPMTQGTLQ